MLSFFSCGQDDLACNILTGGACAIISGVSNLNDPCKLGLSSCNNGKGIANIKETNTTANINPGDLNTTPSLIAREVDITLNVGEKYNVILKVTDRDLDDVNVTAIATRPSVASIEVLSSPDRLLITALASGTTIATAYGKDDDNHIGESQNIKIKVLGGDKNSSAIEEHSVIFSKNKITMNTGGFKRIGYTVKGLQADYTVKVTFASSNNKLVELNVSKSATSIDIYSNATHGTTVASFTFTDSAGITLIKDLQIEVTNSSISPPGDPALTDYTVRDPEACRDTNLWKKLINSYSVGERAIDEFNSITFQSLSTATKNIILYYKDVVDAIVTRPDDAMDIKVDVVPRLDGNRDTDKGFIIQTSKGFFNAGFYYVKIDDQCYRGEFPKNDAVKNHDIYKHVKLVIK